jgi:hypothetical protein
MIRIDTLDNDKEYLVDLMRHFPMLDWIDNWASPGTFALADDSDASLAYEILAYMQENYETPENQYWGIDRRYSEKFDREDFFIFLTRLPKYMLAR